MSKVKKLFAGECNFIAGANNAEALPPMSLTEVAFAGLSNVGKSSLLNALTGRKSLARTSQTPGRTRQLNFFALQDKLILVDLPGYGYAKASKTDIKSWTSLTKDFLCGRSCLRRVCLLIDSRRGIKQADTDYMNMLDDAAVPYQIILTKIDKVKKTELDRLLDNIKTILVKHPAAMPDIMTTSSQKHEGISELQESLAELIEE